MSNKKMEDETRIELLRDAIIKKLNKEKNAHQSLFAQIEKEITDPLNNWLRISKPENVISAETKAFIEDLRISIYLTIKNHDQNQGKAEKGTTSSDE